MLLELVLISCLAHRQHDVYGVLYADCRRLSHSGMVAELLVSGLVALTVA